MNSEIPENSCNNAPSHKDGEVTIDLINVFRFMGQKLRIYAFLLAIFILVGFSVPLLMYQFNSTKASVYGQITFSYKGAEESLAPDGNALDITELASSYVLNRAIENSGIKGISFASIASNLRIEAQLSDEAAKQLEILNSLADNTSAYSTIIQQLEISHSNRYVVTLCNGFGQKPVKYLSDKELYNLLQYILDSYNDYFIEKYSSGVLPVNTICTIDNSNLDYIELLDSSEEFLEYLKEYTENLSKNFPGFSSSEYGMSFKNVNLLIDSILSVDVNPVKADVFSNSVCRDPKTLVSKSKYQIEVFSHNLEEYKSKYNSVLSQIEEYKNSRVVLKSDENNGNESSTFTTVHYNKLIMQLVEYSDKITTTEKNIAYYNDIIDSFTNSKEGANVLIAEKIRKIGDKCNDVYKLVCSCSSELFETSYYKDNFMNNVVISGKADGLGSTAKNDFIGAAAGAFLAVCIWFCDALICEIKSNYTPSDTEKKKEEQI